MEKTQLVLIEAAERRDWRLDERTRRLGLEGVAAARRAVQAARATGATERSTAA